MHVFSIRWTKILKENFPHPKKVLFRSGLLRNSTVGLKVQTKLTRTPCHRSKGAQRPRRPRRRRVAAAARGARRPRPPPVAVPPPELGERLVRAVTVTAVPPPEREQHAARACVAAAPRAEGGERVVRALRRSARGRGARRPRRPRRPRRLSAAGARVRPPPWIELGQQRNPGGSGGGEWQ